MPKSERGEKPPSSSDIARILYEERVIGYLDPGSEQILLKLNSRPNLWTTSSCIGRITIVEGRFHWERESSRIVYKTHDPISPNEILRVMARPFKDLWLKATGPIIHFQTISDGCAFSLLETARRAGFKHSGIISASNGTYTVEIIAPTRIDTPLRIDGKDLHTTQGIALLATKANEALLEGRRRLHKLADNVGNLDRC